jgi:endoribonuclease Dicer
VGVDPDDVDLDPPKFLADLFESVAGAIYLDSNCSLNAVWNAYYSMIEPYLEKFKLNPPQSPIKALDQLKPSTEKKVEFSKNEDSDMPCETICKLTIEDLNFEGRGSNKMQAKAIGIKKPLSFMTKKRQLSFFKSSCYLISKSAFCYY